VSGDYAYVAGDHGIGVIAVSDPAHPVEVGHCGMPGIAWNVALDGAYVYVATDVGGLRVVSTADPANPVEVGYYAAPSAHGIAALGGYAYVAADGGGLWVLQFYGQGVEESPKPQAVSRRFEPTVLSGASSIQRLASSVVFDAMGRRVASPKSGVYFLRQASSVGRGAFSVTKVVIQR
jgi:hypothetical protein